VCGACNGPRFVSHSLDSVKKNLISYCVEEGYSASFELTLIDTALKYLVVTKMKVDDNENNGHRLKLVDFYSEEKRTPQQIIESMNELKINNYLTIINDALLSNGPIHAIIKRYEESLDEETFKRDVFQLCNPYGSTL